MAETRDPVGSGSWGRTLWAERAGRACWRPLRAEAVVRSAPGFLAEWTRAGERLGVSVRFAPAWDELLVGSRGEVLALRCAGSGDVEGLVLLGRPNATPQFLLVDSLLEVAPWNRYEAGPDRRYRFVGTMLVLCLVRESIRLGGRGQLLVRATSAVRPFYECLGFRVGRATAGISAMILDAGGASRLVDEMERYRDTLELCPEDEMGRE